MNSWKRRRLHMRYPSSNGNWDSAEAHNDSDDRLATALGMFSLGLGLAEVTAPGAVANFIGVEGDDKARTILRSYGAREIGTGLGILAQKRPAAWMWGRVGGDMLDIATLAAAMSRPEADRAKIGRAIAMVLGVTALDVYCAKNLTDKAAMEDSGENAAGIPVIRVITINKSPDEVYAFWRNFENLPRFMAHLEAVHTFGDRNSHWIAKAPGGTTAEWDAEVVDDIPGRMILGVLLKEPRSTTAAVSVSSEPPVDAARSSMSSCATILQRALSAPCSPSCSVRIRDSRSRMTFAR